MTRTAQQIPADRTPDPADRMADATMPARRPGRAPRWRSILEARWHARLQEVTELSVAYHDAAAAPALGASGDEAPPARRRLRRLLRQAVTARRALADTEDALARLADGRYGHCEYCASALPPGVLALEPETRYCLRCQSEPAGEELRYGGQVLDARPVA
jgi:RNA polymerase-binding transcription factor DksA